MDWKLSGNGPVYAQLAHALRLEIVAGGFAPGTRLPPVRTLAEQAQVNPNTMQRALAELERTGLVKSRRTAGRFVTEDEERLAQERRALAEERSRAYLSEMDRLGYDRVRTVVLLERLREETKEH